MASLVAHGQSFFNIIPELESIEGQGSCRILFPDFTDFLVFGHKYDTSYAGSNTKPWFARITYDGEIQEQYPLKDESYDAPFNTSFLSFAEIDSDFWYGYLGRFVNGKSVPYVYKFSIQSGEIVSSKLLPNLEFPSSAIIPVRIIFENSKLILLSYLSESDSTKIFITEVDTSYNLLSEVKIVPTTRKQIPKFIGVQNDGSYFLVLDSYRNEQDNKNQYNTSLMLVSSIGLVDLFRWAPTSLPLSNLLVQAKNVIQNSNGDWVVVGHHLKYYPDSCFNCAVQIPYIFSATPDFDSLLWETRFFDIPFIIGPYYDVFSVTQVADGYIGAGELQGSLEGHPPSGTLFKAGLNGDSIWMKHYIPLNWNAERVKVAKFFDVKTTPDGNIIAVGEVYDDSLKGLFPWILHLDKDGCLVPGCDMISGAESLNHSNAEANRFDVYPNPASDQLYLLSRTSASEPYILQLVAQNGEILRQTKLWAEKEYQYSLSMDQLPAGSYYLVLKSPTGNYSEQHLVIKI
jgi:hypothetical protein